MPCGTAPPDPTRVRLRVPARPAFGALTPLTASGLAERVGFTAVAIERVAEALTRTVEAFTLDSLTAEARPGADAIAGVDARPGAELDIGFVLTPGRLVVELEAVRPAATGVGLSAEAWQRLDLGVAPLVSSLERIDGGARISFDVDAAAGAGPLSEAPPTPRRGAGGCATP